MLISIIDIDVDVDADIDYWLLIIVDDDVYNVVRYYYDTTVQ